MAKKKDSVSVYWDARRKIGTALEAFVAATGNDLLPAPGLESSGITSTENLVDVLIHVAEAVDHARRHNGGTLRIAVHVIGGSLVARRVAWVLEDEPEFVDGKNGFEPPFETWRDLY